MKLIKEKHFVNDCTCVRCEKEFNKAQAIKALNAEFGDDLDYEFDTKDLCGNCAIQHMHEELHHGTEERVYVVCENCGRIEKVQEAIEDFNCEFENWRGLQFDYKTETPNLCGKCAALRMYQKLAPDLEDKYLETLQRLEFEAGNFRILSCERWYTYFLPMCLLLETMLMLLSSTRVDNVWPIFLACIIYLLLNLLLWPLITMSVSDMRRLARKIVKPSDIDEEHLETQCRFCSILLIIAILMLAVGDIECLLGVVQCEVNMILGGGMFVLASAVAILPGCYYVVKNHLQMLLKNRT